MRAEKQPVLPKPRSKTAAEMESELRPLAAASVTPVGAISRVRAEPQPVLPKPRAKAAAEMESERKSLVLASVTPVRAMTGRSAACTPSSSLCCPQAEIKTSGRDGRQAEVAGGGERHAGRAISFVRAEQRPVPPKPRAKAAAEMESKPKPLAVASVTACQGDQLRVRRPVPPKPRAKAAAEMEIEPKPLAAASVTPVRAISCACSGLCRPSRERKQRPRWRASRSR